MEEDASPKLIVKNTFIDICGADDSSGSDCSPSYSSPRRRNASAPPSPTKRDCGAWDSDLEEEDNPDNIPSYQWAPNSGIISAEGPPTLGGSGDAASADQVPSWLRPAAKPTGAPPGSPKRVITNRPNLSNIQSRPQLGNILRSNAAPGQGLGFGSGFYPGITNQGPDAFFGFPPPPQPGDRSASLVASASANEHRHTLLGDELPWGLGMGFGCSTQEPGLEGLGYRSAMQPRLSEPYLGALAGLPGDAGGAPSCSAEPSGTGLTGQCLDMQFQASGVGTTDAEQILSAGSACPSLDARAFQERDVREVSSEAPAYILGAACGTGAGQASGPQGVWPPTVDSAWRWPSDASSRTAPPFAQQSQVPSGSVGDSFSASYWSVSREQLAYGGGLQSGGRAYGPTSEEFHGYGRDLPPPCEQRDREPLDSHKQQSGEPPGFPHVLRAGRVPSGDTQASKACASAASVGGELATGAALSSSSTAKGRGKGTPWVMQGVVEEGSDESMMQGSQGAGAADDAAKASKTDIKSQGRVPLSGGGPKRTDYQKKYGGGVDDAKQPQPITTMMLKNIPCRKSQEEVMSHIDNKGFANRYDFFYLPRDVKFRANLGYAFINFLTEQDARSFQAEMSGYRFSGSESSKACNVLPAHVQGLTNNLAAFKRTEVMRSSRKPYFSGAVPL